MDKKIESNVSNHYLRRRYNVKNRKPQLKIHTLNFDFIINRIDDKCSDGGRL